MRIGIDTLFETPGRATGGETFLLNFISHLSANVGEHEVMLFTSKANSSRYVHGDQFQELRCLSSNENRPLRLVSQHLQLPILSRRHGLDVLLCPGNFMPFWKRTKTVVVIQNALHDRQLLRSSSALKAAYRRSAFANVLRRADGIVAISEYLKCNILEHFSITPERIHVAYPGVDTAFWQEQIGIETSRIPDNQPYILFASTLWPHKNLEVVLAALHRLSTEIPHQLVIAGNHETAYGLKIQALVRELRLNSRVTFLGHVQRPELRTLYQGADLVVYPSRIESFGFPVLEAMATGTPVIASTGGALPEVAGGACLLASPDLVDEWVSGIRSLVSDAQLRMSYRAQGLRRVQDFSWDTTVRRVLRVCEAVAMGM